MGLLDGLIGNVLSSAMGGGAQAGGNPLGSLLGSLAASMGGGGAGMASSTGAMPNAASAGGLLSAAMSMVQSQGGLTGLLDKMRQSGLGQHADSWVAGGPNLPVSGAQLTQAVGSDAVGAVAAKLGVPAQQAGGLMAQLLPELINQLTPNGQVPANHGSLLSDGLKMLQGLGH